MRASRLWLVLSLGTLYTGVPLLVYGLRYHLVAPVYLFAGDAFYYLDIARRSLGFHGFSFDGQYPTNGFHPLWEYLLAGAAQRGMLNFAFPQACLMKVYYLNVLLLALGAGCFAAACTRLLSRPTLALLVVAPGLLWFCASPISFSYLSTWSYLNGMESALALLCFGVALLVYRSGGIGVRRATVLSVWLGLASLARLDDAAIAFAVAGLVVLQGERGRRARIALAMSPALLMLAGYLSYNWYSLHLLLPLSGAAKASFSLGTNLHYLIGLFLPVLTGDAPTALLPRTPTYYGFAERTARLTQMIVPAGIALAEIVWMRRWRGPGGQLTLRALSIVDALCFGVILKAVYNLAFVQVWNQGQWYYSVSAAVANVVLVLWLDRTLVRLAGAGVAASESLWFWLPIHLLCVLLAFNVFISRKNFEGPVDAFRLLADPHPLQEKMRSLGADRFLEFDDGFTSFVADRPSMAGLGLALDPEASRDMRKGSFLSLIYGRGYRIVIAHGPYARIVDDAIVASQGRSMSDAMGLHASEFERFRLRPLGGDGSSDALSFYELVAR